MGIFSKVIVKRYSLIVSDYKVMRALEIINRYTRPFTPKMRVGKCCWVNDTVKWVIYFSCRDYSWGNIEGALGAIGPIPDMDNPIGGNRVYYAG